MHPHFKKYLLNITNASACKEIEVIQSLWSDYGKIARYQLKDSLWNTVVVKFIALNQTSSHPRGWNTDFGHQRKVKSYAIETCWYENWNHFCPNDCAVPKFLGAFSEEKDQWIILEDLDENYPLRKQQLNLAEVKVCLKWLAHFHGIFLNKKPEGLWEIGTYWHLKTRPDELEKIERQELRAKAHLIDEILNQCRYQTIVHGDAKVANFCFSKNGEEVAAVDFQYVGGGCGIKDVAYFLGSCLTGAECETYEKELLDYYFNELQIAITTNPSLVDFKELEKEWRDLYPYACADFIRFLLGWMPSHQKVNDYSLKMLEKVLKGV